MVPGGPLSLFTDCYHSGRSPAYTNTVLFFTLNKIQVSPTVSSEFYPIDGPKTKTRVDGKGLVDPEIVLLWW